MSIINAIVDLLIEFKSLIIALSLILLCIFLYIFIIKKFKNIVSIIKDLSNRRKYSDEECIEFKNLTKDEQKLYLMTKVNTSINRDMPANQEKYLKSAYEVIFGENSQNFFPKSSLVNVRTIPKKKASVHFSDKVEYSRN